MAQLQTIYDHAILGGIDANGEIKQVWGNEALSNAILVWVSLASGEVLRSAGSGGYLVKQLMKPMSIERAKVIEEEILRGLSQDFIPVLTNISVTVTPNYNTRSWTIYLSAYSTTIQESVSLQTQVKNLV